MVVDPAASFWERKRAEREFLEQFAEPPHTPMAPPADLESLARGGRDLRARILRRQLAWSVGLPETAEGGRVTVDTPAGTMSYSYQRYDLRRVGCDWGALVHDLPVGSSASDGLFLASGMSAVAAAMSAVSRTGGGRVEISADPYFEVPWLAQRLHTDIDLVEVRDFTDRADVVWIDTLSSEWPALPESPPRLVVIDTSCVEPDHVSVVEWLRATAELGVPAILVRSHIKLDALGLEVGRLGSAVVVGEPAPVEEVTGLLREASSLLGLTFSLPATYPWLGHPDFIGLARERTEGIRRSTRRLTSALAEAGVASLPRPHETSVVVPLGAGAAELPANAVAARVVERARGQGVPVAVAGSFGLDHLVAHDYTDLRDGRQYLRLCGADLPEATEAALADAVARCTRMDPSAWTSRAPEGAGSDG